SSPLVEPDNQPSQRRVVRCPFDAVLRLDAALHPPCDGVVIDRSDVDVRVPIVGPCRSRSLWRRHAITPSIGTPCDGQPLSLHAALGPGPELRDLLIRGLPGPRWVTLDWPGSLDRRPRRRR